MTEDAWRQSEGDARRREIQAREDYENESTLGLSDEADRPIRERWRARLAGFRAWVWRRAGNIPPEA